MALDRRFLNVILLGFGFMFVFTAFQTMGNIEVSEQYFPFDLHPAYVTMNDFSALEINYRTHVKVS
jgi:hypothetical protein